MIDEINIVEYTESRKKENMSVEINDNVEDNIKLFSRLASKISHKNIFNDIYKTIYEETIEEKDENIYKLKYFLYLQEMKYNNLQKDKYNLLYINNKLKYENTLKELILNKNFKDKKCIIEKLKKYHLGYIVWKSLLHESVEDLDLELYLIE